MSSGKYYLETSLDGLDRARTVTCHALQEEQPGLLVEDGVGGPANIYCVIKNVKNWCYQSIKFQRNDA